MLNAASKILIPVALLLAACGGADKSATEANSDKEAADILVAQAAQALDSGDYRTATLLLDSVDKTYRHEIEAGRAALRLRPKVMERKTAQEVVELQTALQAAKYTADSLRPKFTAVPRSKDNVEAYLIAKSVSADWRDRNGMIARMTPSGEFYVISSLQGRSARHRGMRLSGGGASATSGLAPIDKDAALSSESVRIGGGQADTLGEFAVRMDGKPLTLDFIGGNKAPSVTLSAAQIHAIADTWRYCRAINLLQTGSSRLEQLKAKLQLARDQQARASQNDENS